MNHLYHKNVVINITKPFNSKKASIQLYIYYFDIIAKQIREFQTCPN